MPQHQIQRPILLRRKSQFIKKLDFYVGVPLIFVLGLLVRFFGNFASKKKKNRKILIIKFAALGDGVVLLPSLYRLSRLEDYEIYFLAGPTLVSFLRFLPLKVLPLNFKNLLKVMFESWDIIVDYEQWMRSSVLISLSCLRAKKRCGFKSPLMYRHFGFSKTVSFDLGAHTAKNFWNLTRLAIDTSGVSLDPMQYPDDLTASQRWFQSCLGTAVSCPWPSSLIDDTTTYAVIHPGCGDHGQNREWTIERWQQLISILQKKDPDLRIFVTGSGEREDQLARGLQSPLVHSLVGQLSFIQLTQVLAKASYMFCGNTGVMHLASLVNSRGFLCFINGPTSLTLWSPLWNGIVVASELACAPCLTWGHDYGCSDPVCMKSIFVEKLLTRVWDKNGGNCWKI